MPNEYASSAVGFSQLASPTPVDNSYQFGDWISGNTAAKTQAANQARMDAQEWLRNEYSAKQQRAFEEYMDSTKVQRTMADLKAAGLNPWLAVQSAGFGGSTPTGATANSSAGQATTGNAPGSSIAGLGLTALGIAKLIQTIIRIVK